MTMINIGGKQSHSLITNIKKEDIQPNAVDVRVEKIMKIEPAVMCLYNDDRKVLRPSTYIEPENGVWELDEGSYEIIMEGEVEVGYDEAGIIITRSSLNRCGCYLTSGLYDSGYHGVMAACLHVTGGKLVLQKGSRVGQFVLWKAESLHQYHGEYGSDSSIDKTRYHS